VSTCFCVTNQRTKQGTSADLVDLEDQPQEEALVKPLGKGLQREDDLASCMSGGSPTKREHVCQGQQTTKRVHVCQGSRRQNKTKTKA
jgi:hypothetical protein